MSIFKAKIIDVITGEKSVVINEADAKVMMLKLNDRVRISKCEEATKGICESMVCFVEITKTFIQQGEIGVYRDLLKELPISDGEELEVNPAPTP
ncbi:MAG: hypothetical protein N3D72_01150, partial [Candidatus Methanomethyliaceae archaeon]|nr:hypothetical protein [Candidatus Methanomethyliaceae archaeon]